MYQLNYPVPETCTHSTILYQRHVPAQLSCTRDMYQLNYLVPGSCTISTMGPVQAQLTGTRDMYHLNCLVQAQPSCTRTCTSSTTLYQRHVPAQLSCTRDMYQLNSPVPGTCTSSTILYQRHVPAQLSCTRAKYSSATHFCRGTSSAIHFWRQVPPSFPLFNGGQVKSNYASRDKHCTCHLPYNTRVSTT
jgi:hypothetical protein